MAEPQSLLGQYERIKAAHKDEILFFRLGDFYEMFYQDALEASAILNLTLTKRQDAPMCGIPWHASRNYIARLLKAGKKVAICEQMGPAGKGKGIIDREVVEILSPGTAMDEDYLDSSRNNYISSLGVFGQADGEATLALAWLDVSSAEFRAISFPLEDRERLKRLLYSLRPKEILVRESAFAIEAIASIVNEQDSLVNRILDWSFSLDAGRRTLGEHFGTVNMRGFGFEDNDPALAAAGALLAYLQECLGKNLPHIKSLKSLDDGQYLIIDESSQKNLELDRNLRDGSIAYSLLSVMDYTRTAMGSRALRKRLFEPLRSLEEIKMRLDGVESLYREQRALEKIRRTLGSVLDLERLSSRLAMGKSMPRELLGIANTIISAVELQKAVPAESPSSIRLELVDDPDLVRFAETVRVSIMDEPASLLNDGGYIREGWNPELDEQRKLKADAHSVLEEYLEEEKRESGLPNLKIKYNRLIGYFLELGKTAAQSAPEHFIRRQSTVSAERFGTARLSELEARINGASERIVDLEKELYSELLELLKPMAAKVHSLALELSELDCAASMAALATNRRYTRPILEESEVLEVKAGRHPVVEAHLSQGDFIPNELYLDNDEKLFALITGPNMAGKSTFLRQNALIVIMAQAGSFVPADYARIGIADRLFCRVGAQDNLARGESTFLLEMHETAAILNNASTKSLVIMDEVGRGTGTQDGLAIAWAVSEYMLERVGCRTLFATHYHELASIQHEKLINLSMAVDEVEGDIVFLRKIREGAAAGSFGIHVASLAGIPAAVILRAEELRQGLQRQEEAGLALSVDASTEEPAERPPKSGRRTAAPDELFSLDEVILEEIENLAIDAITPLEALNRLSKYKKNLLNRKHSAK